MTLPREQPYEPLYRHPRDEMHPDDERGGNGDGRQSSSLSSEDDALLGKPDEAPFSWLEYIIFCLLGMAMLWAWCVLQNIPCLPFFKNPVFLPSAPSKTQCMDRATEMMSTSTEYGVQHAYMKTIPRRNMFLAAAPYFASRFAADPSISSTFQSTVLAVSTITNLVTVTALSRAQSSSSYAPRIQAALAINTLVFAALVASTSIGLGCSPKQYLAFLLLSVAAASFAAGLLQNGGYAFVAGFARPEYMQAVMTGQGVAGVLPAVAQVISVLLYPPGQQEGGGGGGGGGSTRRHVGAGADGGIGDGVSDGDGGGSTGASAAFAYFTAAAIISALTFLAMLPLVRRHRAITASKSPMNSGPSSSSSRLPGGLLDDDDDDDNNNNNNNNNNDNETYHRQHHHNKPIPFSTLLFKLRWLSSAVVILFSSTMFFPIFTTKITSLHPSPSNPLSQPFAFIPLAFFSWNLGDLSGRVITANPSCALTRRPPLLFLLSVLRIAQGPLYMLCNVGGRGALVPSDAFYFVVVQFGYGLSNGWLFSSIMMATGEWVDEREREAAGGFMGIALVGGLALGSLLSFAASGV